VTGYCSNKKKVAKEGVSKLVVRGAVDVGDCEMEVRDVRSKGDRSGERRSRGSGCREEGVAPSSEVAREERAIDPIRLGGKLSFLQADNIWTIPRNIVTNNNTFIRTAKATDIPRKDYNISTPRIHGAEIRQRNKDKAIHKGVRKRRRRNREGANGKGAVLKLGNIKGRRPTPQPLLPRGYSVHPDQPLCPGGSSLES